MRHVSSLLLGNTDRSPSSPRGLGVLPSHTKTVNGGREKIKTMRDSKKMPYMNIKSKLYYLAFKYIGEGKASQNKQF